MVASEFQAVVLAAGRGSRMTELTVVRPKCLLPVGNKPILHYSLKALEKAGFTNAIVVVLETAQSEVNLAISKLNIELNIDLVTIPSDNDWGTADSLRHLINQEKIKSNVVLVSCDIFTSSDISNVLHVFRKHKASLSALFFSPSEDLAVNNPVPGLKAKYKPEKDIVGIDKETSRLVFLASASDFEENVKISRNVIRHHPKLSLRTDLVDGHVYVLSRNLALYLTAEKSFGTLKGEFFPYVVSKQHLKQTIINEESYIQNESSKRSLFEYVAESELETYIQDLSMYNDHQGDLKRAYNGDVLRCYAVLGGSESFGIRINSIQALCQANNLVLHQKCQPGDDNAPLKIDASAQISSTQVDNLSFIGGGCSIKEKTSVKESVLGENCTVHPKTLISKSVLFNKVKVNEGCTIENSILCDGSVIGPGCDLRNCIVGAHHVVPEGTKVTFQVLTKSEGLMEI